jgi:ABC-type transport system substrate-binding protein
MHRRLWFLTAAALAVLAVVGSASAMTREPNATKASAPANGFTMAKVAPFAKSWAATPRTPAARAAKSTISIAMEQDIGSGDTWNINQANSTLAWAVWVGWNPILRSPYVVDYIKGHYKYKLDLATKVKVNHKSITYYIRKNANWNWGGKKMPVTWKDFAYTVEQLNNPKNEVSSDVGVNQIGRVTHKGNKVVTFWWKKNGEFPLGGAGKGAPKGSNQCSATWPCGPFADYKDLIGGVYPSAALKGLNFNTFWAKGITGRNGKPISDGPYLMTNYTRGAGVTLKANPDWYGHKPAIKTVNFKIITNIDSEIEAVKGGEVDAAAPQPVPAISALRSDKKVVYKVAPGNYLEHIDIQQGKTGPQTSPTLTKQAWFRQVLMLGINRAGIIKAALPGVAPGLKPLNSLLVFQSDSRYKNFFNKWNYNPKKAIAMLKAHGCTGGPSKPGANGHYYTCGGHLAQLQFMYASDNPRRVASEEIIQANLAAIGIKIIPNGVPTSTLFGANGAPAGNYDLTEFAWGGAVDPGGFISIWGCGGGENWLNYCSQPVTKDLDKTLTQLNVKKRNADFIAADKIMSNDVPAIPLYALPSLLVYKKTVAGMTDNPAAGFTYDMEQWKWK